jgi:hypothetical protein
MGIFANSTVDCTNPDISIADCKNPPELMVEFDSLMLSSDYHQSSSNLG